MAHSGDRNWLDEAMAGAASASLRADDIACTLFPKSGEMLAEDLLASVRSLLFQLVCEIEAQLIGPTAETRMPKSWDILCRSGLLRIAELIDFCIARLAERQIRQRLEKAGFDAAEQLPAQLLHAPDPQVAAAARNILRGDSLAMVDSAPALVAQLPAELLHGLAWKVVATLQFSTIGKSFDSHMLVAACQRMLALRNEGNALQASASKLVYFAPPDLVHMASDVRQAGLSVFIAALSRDLNLSQDAIYRFLMLENPAPSMAILRAAGQTAESAFANLSALRFGWSVSEQNLFSLDDLAGIDRETALQTVNIWGMSSAMEVNR